VWSPNLGGVFFSFPLCWSEASVLQDGVNVLYEGEDCGGKQVRDPWRHHRPRQERHHWTETRKQQTTNEDRSGSIKQPLRLVSYFTSPSTPPIGHRFIANSARCENYDQNWNLFLLLIGNYDYTKEEEQLCYGCTLKMLNLVTFVVIE
ncbi:hypothetical protein CAPTEDRAFT_215709, partial [Capitella teleta]